MPTSFHPEALKAQAVVSRTYTLRRLSAGKHDEADICTDSACCQGWTDLDAYCLENNLTSSDEKIQAVFQAVRDTDGEVLTYDGGLIDATYFSSAGGQTEAAVEVWGSDVPYLQSVDSPEAEAPYNDEQVTFSPEEFAGLIYTIAPQANLSGSPDTSSHQFTVQRRVLFLPNLIDFFRHLRPCFLNQVGRNSNVIGLHIFFCIILKRSRQCGHKQRRGRAGDLHSSGICLKHLHSIVIGNTCCCQNTPAFTGQLFHGRDASQCC